jgi:hypothetical protein
LVAGCEQNLTRPVPHFFLIPLKKYLSAASQGAEALWLPHYPNQIRLRLGRAELFAFFCGHVRASGQKKIPQIGKTKMREKSRETSC